MTSLSISCNDCTMQNSDHCRDCVVTFLCDSDGAVPVAIEEREVRALRLLSAGGWCGSSATTPTRHARVLAIN